MASTTRRKEWRGSEVLRGHGREHHAGADATGGDAVADQPAEAVTLIARAGRIEYVGPASEAPPAPPEVRRIDGRGLTLLPGLIDAHVHLSLSSGPFDDLQRESIASVSFKA